MNMTKVNTIYLNEDMRIPGKDHLEEYRASCFYPLLKKSVKERGNAYETLAAKILTGRGLEASVASASHGSYDLIINGKKFELKASRKASMYDTRNRSYQFSQIKDNGKAIILMIIQPDDVVKLYGTTFEDIKDHLGSMHKDKAGNTVAWNLAKSPEEIGLEVLTTTQIK